MTDGQLQAAYLPKAAVLDTNAFGGAVSLRRLSLPAAAVTAQQRLVADTGIEELNLRGPTKLLRGTPFAGSGKLNAIHFGATVPVQEGDAFAGTNAGLVGYYTGNHPAWSTFTFRGNPTATLKRE